MDTIREILEGERLTSYHHRPIRARVTVNFSAGDERCDGGGIPNVNSLSIILQFTSFARESGIYDASKSRR